MNILVTGGAGYIGAVVVDELLKAGHQVVVYDSLLHGDRNRVGKADLVVGDILDTDLLVKTMQQYNVEAVMHFAALVEVGESMQKPYDYFQVNAYGSLSLFQAMVKANVYKIIVSSTAAVYGTPQRIPILETDPKIPENPYGEAKLMMENMLSWFAKIHQFKYVVFRYFNAAGASLDGKLGNFHKKAAHLIPNIIKAALSDRVFTINGNDYPTLDGTCVRDYIHVLDLSQAHILGLDWLNNGQPNEVFNVGTGQGYSIMQVLKLVEEVVGKKIQTQIGPRRLGDPAELAADSSKLQKMLGWQAKYSDLHTIVASAWKWHNR